MIDVHAFVQVYNFCHDGGGIYTPTDRDKAMLEDAINCYIAECEQSKPHLEDCFPHYSGGKHVTQRDFAPSVVSLGELPQS